LTYHAEFAALVGADVINIHGGGAYGDKASALDRVRRNIDRLNDTVRSRLTLENDDRVYTPEDLLPVCRDMEVPMVYDVHHHRCLIDGDSEESATQKALSTWNREPLFHISSPAVPWGTGNVKNHADYIDVRDIPPCWFDLEITVEVEAKAKELAVLQVIDTVGSSSCQ
jgi:UV DNA damage endonuclease